MFRPVRSATCILALVASGWLMPDPAVAQDGLAGAYLAARQASGNSDYAAAAGFYTKALMRDPSNPELLEGGIVSYMALGDIDAAAPVARRLREVSPQSTIAELVLAADQLKRGDFDAVLADYEAGKQVGPLVDGLIVAWAELARGNVSAAMEAFDKVSGTEALLPFGNYHKALALALVGDFEAADKLFALVEQGGTQGTRRGVLAHAQVLGQLGRADEAVALLDRLFVGHVDSEVQALRDALASGEAPAFTELTGPMEGIAEIFFSVAVVLDGQAEDTYTLLYSRAAEILAPADQSGASLLSAEILERQGQHDLATAAYNRIPREDPAFPQAELGRAQTMDASGKTEAAIEVLEQLAKSHPTLSGVHRALGEMLSDQKRFAEAKLAYDAAIETLAEDDPSRWVVLFFRGISEERTDRWDEAEADFRKALELQPDQPSVLNYLGYSYLEKGENFDEALEMIQRAVAVRPDDGAIVDSLGWALYRLGRYEEAVEPMEKAASLMAVDAVVNDHLGDVYWAVGRQVEARFQWRRALSFEPEADEAERIRRKLEVGLDAVLAEEGAKPLAVANDGG